MSTSQWTIAAWNSDEGEVELVASVKLKENHKQDLVYLLRFGSNDREVEIDAKDVKLLLASRSIVQDHRVKPAARVAYNDDSDDEVESFIAADKSTQT